MTTGSRSKASSRSYMTFSLNRFIQRHVTYKGEIEYKIREIEELIEIAKAIIQSEPRMVEVPTPVNIVGDIHGQFGDLQRIFTALGHPGNHRYLFLGDYVDRGPQSMECICWLLAYKIAFPSRIYLLRGNHECEMINRAYGFWEELQKRYSIETAAKLYKDFNDLFSYFPLTALVRRKILCMHGGLSPRINSLEDLKNVRVFLDPPPHSLEQDLLWADPMLEGQGFQFNDGRGASVQFGEDVVHDMCKKLGLDLVVRAHQVMQNGYGFFANRKLCTVFSAPRYSPELNNQGGVMKVSKSNNITFLVLNPPKETSTEQGPPL